jgi:hypothetical protein
MLISLHILNLAFSFVIIKVGTYTKDGVTCTYVNYSAIINELMKIRKDNGINANSNLNVVAAQNDLYAATIDDKVALKIAIAHLVSFRNRLDTGAFILMVLSEFLQNRQ